MDEKVSNHPCHRLSIPSAKLFWCRHCMQSFEDPINRWRHSKTCKMGGPSNHDKRLEQEPFALQTYCEMKQREDAGGQSSQLGQATQVIDTVTGEQLMILRQETVENEAKAEYSCFICKRPFDSLEDMKEHVKYPCSKYDLYDYPIYIPGSGGTFVEAPKEIPDSFPSASRKFDTITLPRSCPPNVITRRPVLGEIIEQSADPQTGIRTFEVHSQNDDIPLSDILSKLSEGGYLVAGEDESLVNQVVVVQQVDEKGQITQTEHVLPPHIQIQNAISSVETEDIETEPVSNEETNSVDVTYYVSETGEVIEPFVPVPVKQEIKQELYYGDYGDQLSGMNILTQAAEATIGNLIYPEKRKNEDDEKEDENVKRSRSQCKPDDDSPNQQPPHSPRSPRQPDGASWNGSSAVTIGAVTQEVKTEKCDSPNNGGKQQNSVPDAKDDESNLAKEKKSKRSKKSCVNEFKCRICDKSFKTSQLLHRHSQFPCKVFNTRNMCQKILRPKRGPVVGKTLDSRRTPLKLSHTNSKAKSKSTNIAQIYRKPMLLMNGSLRAFSTLNTDRKPKPKIKKKIVYIPTPPSTKTIWLPEKEPLTVKELSEKEQFFYEVGLVLCQHLTKDADIKTLQPSIIYSELQSQEIENVFTPLMISADVECLKNSNLVEEFYSPPVLERMDIPGSFDEQHLQEEPPVLISVLDVAVEKDNKIDSHDICAPLLENDYRSLEFSEFSTPMKDPPSKIGETRRHFMDLFLEASPSTAQRQDGHFHKDGNKIEKHIVDKPAKEIKMKEDLISKLTSDLKKKLSPPKLTESKDDGHSQNIPFIPVVKLSDVKHDLLSSFNVSTDLISENPEVEKSESSRTEGNFWISTDEVFKPLQLSEGAEQHTNCVTGKTLKSNQVPIGDKNLVLPFINVSNNSPSKINVIIYKCKAQFRGHTLKKHLLIQNTLNSSHLKVNIEDGTCTMSVEDEVCETLDKMLSDVSDNVKLQNQLISTEQNINSKTNVVKSLQKSGDYSVNNTSFIDANSTINVTNTIIIENKTQSNNISVSSNKTSSDNNLKLLSDNISKSISNNDTILVDNEKAFDTVASNVAEIKLVNYLDNFEVMSANDFKNPTAVYNSNSLVECEKPCFNGDKGDSLRENSVLLSGDIVEGSDIKPCEIINFDQLVSPEPYSILSSPDTKSEFEFAKEFTRQTDIVKQKSNVHSQDHVPEFFNLLVNGRKDVHLKMKSRLCTLPQFLMDEGIVSDIIESKDESTNKMWEKTLFPNDFLKETPKVTVQYIEQMDTSGTLTSDKLNYVLDDNDYNINKSSSDYLVNKIALCEEEIVLSDSGLDDSDEPISQNSLEEDRP